MNRKDRDFLYAIFLLMGYNFAMYWQLLKDNSFIVFYFIINTIVCVTAVSYFYNYDDTVFEILDELRTKK